MSKEKHNKNSLSKLSNRLDKIENQLNNENLSIRIKKLEDGNYDDLSLEKKIGELKREKKHQFWLPTIISILAIIVSVFSILNEHIIANKSGDFDKGDAELALGNFELDKSKESVIIVVNEIENIDVLLLGIPFSIHNSGNLNLENSNLTISYPNANGRIAVDTEKFIKNDTPLSLTRNYYHDEIKDFIRYEIPKIQPKESISFYELIVFRNTSISSNVEVKDKDSVPLNLKYKIEISYDSKITLNSDNVPSTTYNITYHHFHLKDWENIQGSDFLIQYVSDEQKDIYLLTEAENEKHEIEDVGSITTSNFKFNKVAKFY